ncbi:polyprenyl synthetase family protein [Paracoccus aerius]|uniref:Polyprenyl synthetase family protein n=1 Tax=Paracoccus aerius TaxID=1915382 RepID=A0ABS1S4S4_9RHOB|nr:polyprenyl synthetase family protein [Paracoccus aerius]MBL3673723.1 polyprenyl synthetase family protein [Paracoccus aerius]GHG22858.1 (2E,6E)-farnesyl diphosphate synthase [Paracoccus aerius]
MHQQAIDKAKAAPTHFDMQESFVRQLDARITHHLSQLSPAPARLIDAASDAMGSGKRLRPYLLHLVAGDVADRDAVLDMAVALEMVHTASLIVDDLPSMDNAMLRRGRPTTHARFGEATAILTAIGLLNHAISIANGVAGLADGQRGALVSILSGVMGWQGLVAGQELDLHGFSDRDGVDDGPLDRITRINALKTGALLCAAVEAGAILGGRPDAERSLLRRFGEDLGQAFQIADDLIDMLSDSAATGKDCRKDVGKETYLAVYGAEEALRRCRGLLASADAALVGAGLSPEPFRCMIDAIFTPMLDRVPQAQAASAAR